MPQPDDSFLPEPDADARVHGARVHDAIVQAIDAARGFLPFDRYMQIALYEPGLGYYIAGTRKFGASGDFVTAPELTPLFGRTLAAQIAAILEASRAREIVELGAGSGSLAAELLTTLAANGAPPARYRILEVSAELRERQRATIGQRATSQLPNVEWLQDLPERIDGAVVMNEVLDAIPVRLVARRGGEWLERGVGHENAQLAWREQPLQDAQLTSLAAARFPSAGDYQSEINLGSEALVEDLGRRLAAGAMLILDYGFPRAEYYHPERREGTLMGHYRHRAHSDPLLWPGLSDITAHVDFTSIAEAGERSGLSVAGYTTQASFLIACGLLERLGEVASPQSIAYLREASAVQTLTSMSGMGERFKVLALARSDDIDWRGFSLSDRSHRL